MGTLQALDEAALQLFIDKDDVHSLRIENEKLREKLRQFNQVDMKKSADLKAKNDDLSALQKELSNTKHRLYEQKTDRAQEMLEMTEALALKTDELEKLKHEVSSKNIVDKNFEKQIEINRKEMDFLRNELEKSRKQVSSLQEELLQQEDYKSKHELTEKLRRQAELEKAHGANWRHEVKKLKVIEKELEQFKSENKELRVQAQDKAVAMEKEKLWRSTVDRIKPKCLKLEAENEQIQGELVRANEKIKHIQNEVNDARTAELMLTNQLGTIRAELAVEKSRNKAAENTISELKRDLEITKTDISLSQSALQGDVDISALRDEIKALERQNAELAEEVARYRALGNFDPNKENVLRFSKNPTDQRRKRPRSENSEASDKSEISEEEKVLVKDLKEQLFREKKSKEKVLEIVKKRIESFREAIAEILGYQVTSNDYEKFKFLSIYAQNREECIQFERVEVDGRTGFQLLDSPVFNHPELSGMLQELDRDSNLPNLMSKTTLQLSGQQTLML